MQNIAMSWLVYRITGSVFLLGVVGFTNQVPNFIFSPFAGVLTDRYNKLRIMIWTQIFFLVQALALGILTLTGAIQVWHIILLSLFFGLISVFDTPARQSLVVYMVPDRKDIGNAIALNSALFNGARLIGPSIAGFVIAYTGEGICFLLNAASYLSIIVALAFMRIKIPVNKQDSQILEGLKEGYRYTFHSIPIRFLIITLSIISLMGMPYVVMMPAFAKEILHSDSKVLGFLMSAAGLGALSAALFLASRKNIRVLPHIIFLAILTFGAGIMGLSFSSTHILAYIMMFLAGFGMVAAIAGINTLIQHFTSDEMRGRVLSFYAIALLGMNPIGNFLAGSAASVFGLKITLFTGGLACFLTGIFYRWYTKKEQFKAIF